MAFLQNTFTKENAQLQYKKLQLKNNGGEDGKDFSIHCCLFDPQKIVGSNNNNNNNGQATLVLNKKCEDLEALRRINKSYLTQNLGMYTLERNNTKQHESIQLLGLSHDMDIYLPLYPSDVNAVLDYEFSMGTVSANKLKTIKKIVRASCERIPNILCCESKYELTFSKGTEGFLSGGEVEEIGESDRISKIVYHSQCQHKDLLRLTYHLRKNNELSQEAYDKYISNLRDKSIVSRMDDNDDINKVIEGSKCRESDFQQILALTSIIPWNTTSTYFTKRLLYEIRRDLKNLEFIQRAMADQYKHLELTDRRDKSLDSQYFDTHSFYILPCYYVPSKHIIQDSSNKKANKLSRSEVSKEEDVTFEMKTRVMKKTTDMKQIVKQLRLYEARYPPTNELSYYIGISVNEEVYCPRKKEDFIKILKENISDWKVGNKDGRYGVKACGKRFRLNNKTYTNTERHQMPDIFEYSSMVHKKYFGGMKSFDLIVSRDDLSVQKVILSRDDGFEAPEKYRTISNVVENSKCVDTEFVKLVSSLWNEEILSQVSLVKYCNSNNLDIEKVEKLIVGTDHRQVINVSSTVAPDFLYLVQLLARVNTPFLLDYCRYFLTSIPKLFDDRKSVLNFYVSVLGFIRKRK